MAPFVRAHPSSPRTPATVTVAELLARQDAGTGPEAVGAPEGDPLDADDVPTEPISVAALLRREGCGPHTADRPLLPRGHSRPVTPPPGRSRRNLGTVTAAAGVLFAAGAVFGTALVDNTLRRPTHPPDSVTNTPAGEQGGAGEALRAFIAEPDAGTLVSGGTLATLLFADAIPGSATGALEGADPFGGAIDRHRVVWADGQGTGAGPTYRANVFPIGKPPDSAGPVAPADGTPPGGTPPSGGTPGGEAGGPGGGGPDTPARAPTVVLPLPEVSTPPVEIPGGTADVPVVGRVRTPVATISEARVAPPQVALTAGAGKAEVASSPAAVGTPDLRLSEAEAGPLRVSRAEVAVPDVEVSAARVTASAGSPPEVALPSVKVSGAELATPDVELGDVKVKLPDVKLPDVEVPAVRLGGDHSGADTGETAEETDEATDETAEETDDTAEETDDAVEETVETVDETVRETTESITSTVRSLGEAAAAALDQD
ncbi:hypothetical protein GCM10009609_27540 [Pseudonocardia aurantiaca]|uniref:Uncharacterized protein n=1 Tax=Pseudonocardia aurantiaca TaxID=75290 RepID=A0ABW4FIF6_9PSEU